MYRALMLLFFASLISAQETSKPSLIGTWARKYDNGCDTIWVRSDSTYTKKLFAYSTTGPLTSEPMLLWVKSEGVFNTIANMKATCIAIKCMHAWSGSSSESKGNESEAVRPELCENAEAEYCVLWKIGKNWRLLKLTKLDDLQRKDLLIISDVYRKVK